MWLRSDDFDHGGPIPERHAMGKHHPDTNATFSDNINPNLSWGDLPAGTESLALIMVDTCAPTVGDDVNQPGRTVPRDLPRANFYHWVVVGLEPAAGQITAGSHAAGVVPGGKSAVLEAVAPTEWAGSRQGLNSYTDWFAGDTQMSGSYFGYDGPFPPWNDELTHQYEFTMYALDARVGELPEAFTARDVMAAMEGHVLDSATLTGTYRINPS